MNDPMNFPLAVSSTDFLVELRDVLEISQGGPITGKLFVNDKPMFEELRFGGPMYINMENLFLTKRLESFLFNGFKLCKLNLVSSELFEFDVKHDLISIVNASSSEIVYKTSLDLCAGCRTIPY